MYAYNIYKIITGMVITGVVVYEPVRVTLGEILELLKPTLPELWV